LFLDPGLHRGDEYAKNTSREIDQNVKLLIHDEYFGDMVT